MALKLHVANVLEGSVRRSGNRIRVTAQLIRAADDFHVWSQTYDQRLEDVFKVQDEIAEAVVTSLKVHLLPVEQPVNPFATKSNEAHEHYLLGMLHGSRTSDAEFRLAVEEFRKAISLDPNYAIALSKLAYYEYRVGDMDGDVARSKEALALAEKAIVLAPNLAEGYAARAQILTWFARDWSRAEADVKKALELEPNNTMALTVKGYLLAAHGRPADAVEVARKVVDLDSLSSLSWGTLAFFQYLNSDWNGSRQNQRRALELAPQSDGARARMGLAEILDGHADVALDLCRPIPTGDFRLPCVALAQHALGHEKEAQGALRELIANHAAGEAYQVAEIYAFSGDLDSSFRWLDRAYLQNDGGLFMLRTDHFLDNLRGDPRFKAMLVKMKLGNS